MLQVLQTQDRYVLTAGDLRLECLFVADRWQHRILVWQKGVFTPLLESVEGDSDDRFPPSPAFQEIMLEKKSDDCSEVQLFGRAGKNLYAAAILIDNQAGEIVFDVSIRMRGEESPEFLGGSYRLSKDFDASTIESAKTVKFTGEDLQEFVLQSTSVENSPPCEISITPSRELKIGCLDLANIDLLDSGAAIRWIYRISGVSDA